MAYRPSIEEIREIAKRQKSAKAARANANMAKANRVKGFTTLVLDRV